MTVCVPATVNDFSERVHCLSRDGFGFGLPFTRIEERVMKEIVVFAQLAAQG
jgi:hypothetical protein